LGSHAKIVAEVGTAVVAVWLQLPSETQTNFHRKGRKERKVFFFNSLRSCDQAQDKPLRPLRFN
jgi:hypothetical protein